MVTEVGDIMTVKKEMIEFQPADGAEPVREQMEKEKIDVAPVTAEGEIRKFLRKKNLQEIKPTRGIGSYSNSLESKHLVSKKVPILSLEMDTDLLTIWKENGLRFSFVIDRGIEGIVTLADLNKPIAGMPFYWLFISYDHKGTKLIKKKFPYNRWQEYLDSDDVDEIKSRHGDEKKENAQLQLADCLLTDQIGKVLFESNLWEEIGVEKEKEAESLFTEDLPNFRNKIMHQRKLVYEGQSFEDIYKITQKVKGLVSNIEKRLTG